MNLSNLDKNVLTKLNNPASEKGVLAGLIRYGKDAYLDVSSLIEEDTFTIDENKVIYKCLIKLFETSDNVDLSSIISASQQLSLYEYLEKGDRLKQLNHLMHYEIHIDNIRKHAQKLRKLQLTRSLQNELRSIYLKLNDIDGDESINEITSIPETDLQKITLKYLREDNSSTKLIGENIDNYLQLIISNQEKEPGISTGYPIFDTAIGGGLRRGAVDLIGARAKAGKSTLADNVALDITKRGIPVLVLDTEMGQEDHWNRLLANISGIPINDIASSKFNKDPEQVKKIEEASEVLKEIPYHYISVAGRPFDEILGITRRWLFKEVKYNNEGRMNECLVIYDYMKLMTSDSISGNIAEYQALGFQITQLVNFCVEYDIPCLSFVQLNRDGITKETEDAISGSDRLIWLCTSFSIFKARTEEEINEENVGRHANRRLVPIVSRHGPGSPGKGGIYMNMRGELAKLEEIGTKRDAEKQARINNEGFEQQGDSEDSDDSEHGEDT